MQINKRPFSAFNDPSIIQQIHYDDTDKQNIILQNLGNSLYDNIQIISNSQQQKSSSLAKNKNDKFEGSLSTLNQKIIPNLLDKNDLQVRQGVLHKNQTKKKHTFNDAKSRTSTIVNSQMNKYTQKNYIPCHKKTLMNKTASTTVMLYSKFIVKGMKDQKIPLVKEALNRTKTSKTLVMPNKVSEHQNMLASSQTLSKKIYKKHLRRDDIKTFEQQMQSQYTEQTTPFKRYQQRPQSSNKRQKDDTNTELYRPLSGKLNNNVAQIFKKYQDEKNDRELNNFFKKQAANSNKKNRQFNEKYVQINQRALQRPQSASNLAKKYQVRPQTASNAKNSKSPIQNRHVTFYESDQVEGPNDLQFINNILNIKDKDHKLISKNYVQENKRKVSENSKKTSFYLTGVGKVNISNPRDNKSLTQESEHPYWKQLDQIIYNQSKDQQLLLKKMNTIHRQNELSNAEKLKCQIIRDTHIQNILRKVPHKYDEYVQHLNQCDEDMEEQMRKRQQKLLQIQGYPGFNQAFSMSKVFQPKNQISHLQKQKKYGLQLMSKPLDPEDNRPNRLNSQVSQAHQVESASKFMKTVIRECEVLQCELGDKWGKKQNPKQDKRNILIPQQCQLIIQLYNQLTILEQHQEAKQKQKRKQILKYLQRLDFFADKNHQMKQKIMNLPISIELHSLDQEIIKAGEPIHQFFLIINGSVKKVTEVHQKNVYAAPSSSASVTPAQQIQYNQNKEKKIDQEDQKFGHLLQHPFKKHNPNQQQTLFEGQVFGMPQFPSQALHTHKFVVQQQQTLLMRIPYLLYENITSKLNNLSDKINVAKAIFNHSQLINEAKIQKFTKAELEMIAVQMQEQKYSANSIICRAGQQQSRFFMIGSGQVALVQQHIMQNQKEISKDVKKKPAFFSTDQQSIPEIQNYRKINLINYEVLRDTPHRKIFYYFEKKQSLLKGDAYNWGAISEIPNENGINFSQICNMHFSKPIKYSLMTIMDDTIIYSLTFKKLQYLPDYIRQNIITLASLHVQRNSKSPKIKKSGSLNPHDSEFKKWIRKTYMSNQKSRNAHCYKQDIPHNMEAHEWKNFKDQLCKNILYDKKNKKINNFF